MASPIKGPDFTSLDEFKNVLRELDANSLRYWVFGGYALDGLRQGISRAHGDIDIYLFEDDLDRFKRLYSRDGCEFKRVGSMYFVKSASFRIGALILAKDEDSFIAYGNKTLARYPMQMFDKDIFATIQDLSFRIAPLEALVLESRFSRWEDDRGLGQDLDYDKEIYDGIVITHVTQEDHYDVE